MDFIWRYRAVDRGIDLHRSAQASEREHCFYNWQPEFDSDHSPIAMDSQGTCDGGTLDRRLSYIRGSGPGDGAGISADLKLARVTLLQRRTNLIDFGDLECRSIRGPH